MIFTGTHVEEIHATLMEKSMEIHSKSPVVWDGPGEGERLRLGLGALLPSCGFSGVKPLPSDGMFTLFSTGRMGGSWGVQLKLIKTSFETRHESMDRLKSYQCLKAVLL